MAQIVPHRATYADLKRLPANMVGEIIFGALHAQPRPVPRHAVASFALGGQLDGPFQRGSGGGPGGWVFMTEPELHLGDHVIVPDIAGWRRETLPKLPDTAFIETPPDWVCEVLSPSTRAIDRTDKLAIYATFGVGHAWYVEPDAKLLEAMALSDSTWQITATFKNNDNVCAAPFEAHTFSLGNLWPLDSTDTSDTGSPST